MLSFQTTKQDHGTTHRERLVGRVITDVAFGASAGASVGALAGTAIASGIALPILLPFALAGTGALVGGALSYSAARHKR